MELEEERCRRVGRSYCRNGRCNYLDFFEDFLAGLEDFGDFFVGFFAGVGDFAGLVSSFGVVKKPAARPAVAPRIAPSRKLPPFEPFLLLILFLIF